MRTSNGSAAVMVERVGSILHAACLVCGAATSQPDKGIGRANLAAWRTRHQHAATDQEDR